jgi:hypothetical protein
LELLQPKNLWE